jgi:hypothetical protein
MKKTSTWRRWVLIVLALGLLGTTMDLVLIQHYEDSLQLIPIGLAAFALVVASWNGLQESRLSVRLLQLAMILLLVAGLVGVTLHYRGAAAFQWEMDATQSSWSVFTKVIRAKAPPLLAPGAMLQLGLIGLVYCYRHPAVTDLDD